MAEPPARPHRPHVVTATLGPRRPGAGATPGSTLGPGSGLSASPPSPPVTLTAPRPDSERACNEYVEAPFRPPVRRDDKPGRVPGAARLPPPAPSLPGSSLCPRRPPITKQPGPFLKDPGLECAASFICSDCGRCRCERCRSPRPLPQRWVCDNSCLCSAQTALDYASCLCCVKGLYYHCSESDAGATSCADEPCSCGPERWAARWGCMSLMSLVLPCLLCYWPLRGCVHALESCYARHSRSGCRCPPPPPPSDRPEKRPLRTHSPCA